MFHKLFNAMFSPKYPKGYTGKHRARLAFVSAAEPSSASVRLTLIRRQATA